MSKVEEGAPLEFTQELLRAQQRLDSLTGELRSAVVAWQIASESGAFEAALGLWAAWSANISSEDASELPPALALPPPCVSDCVRAVLRPHCTHLIRGGASTGNVVLHGVVGVGKTTLLKVCAMLHAVRHVQATVVFWDYEASPVQYFPPDPHHILRQVMHWARGDRSAELLPPTVDNVWAPFGYGMLSDARAMCGVYCDEINYLYRPASRYDPTKDEPPATATVAWGQTCVTRLVNLGKDTNCLVMCSGSASVLRAMVFPLPHGPWRRYQGLNHSVYRIKTVLPLRSGEQVMKYVRQRYPHIDIDDDTARRLFRATGGVGRRIAKWARTGDDLDMTAETAAKDTLRILRDSSDPLHHAVTSFACRVFSRYTYSDYDDGDERKMPDSVCLPLSHVASTDFAYGAVDALVDAGIVFVAGREYEYLVPAVADYVAAELRRDATAVALNAMRTVVCGWEGKGSAGAAAAPLVFQHLVHTQRDTISIRVVDGTPFVDHGGTSTSLSDFGVDNLCGRVVTVAKDTGADGFVLEVDSNWAKKKKKKAKRRFRVTAYQIKLGDFNFKFRAGVLATQRGYSNNSSRDKRTMAGIVACLEVGWQQFSTLLAAAFSDATFVLDSAWVLSNKQLPSNGMTPSHTRVRDGTVRGLLRRRGWVPLHTLCKWEFYAKLPSTLVLAVVPHHHATTVLAKLA